MYHRVDAAGRRSSQYVARGGVWLFFPREPGESAEARTVAVAPIVRRLRAEIKDPRMTDSGWSFREFNSRDRRNWDCMADWLHERRLQYRTRVPRCGFRQHQLVDRAASGLDDGDGLFGVRSRIC